MEHQEITSFAQAEEFLSAINKFMSEHTVHDTAAFYQRIGMPGSTCKIIHVVGTNGKGSVCSYLNACLREAGFHVGMFTSPHLVTVRERFRLDGEMISEPVFLQNFKKLEQLLQQQGQGLIPNYFEMLFLIAMLWYQDVQPDFLILEAGLGGRLDATNIVPQPACSVITEIGLDHMQYLGDTIPKIAAEKAGIIKAGVPVVYRDFRSEASEVIEKRAKETGADCYPVAKIPQGEFWRREDGIDFHYHSSCYSNVSLHLSSKALYQLDNACVAIRVLEILDGGERVTEAILKKGLSGANWEGRMEEIAPHVFLDGAHNRDGIDAFLDTVRNDGCIGKRHLMFSVVADKEYQEMAADLVKDGLFENVILTAIQNGRALEDTELLEVFSEYRDRIRIEQIPGTREAVEQLFSQKKKEDYGYIVGSLYLVGQVKALLEEKRKA